MQYVDTIPDCLLPFMTQENFNLLEDTPWSTILEERKIAAHTGDWYRLQAINTYVFQYYKADDEISIDVRPAHRVPRLPSQNA
jgi:hypothetical protein